MAISKIKLGSGFAGVLAYVSEKDQASFILKNGVFHDSSHAIASEMRANADQKNLKKPVLHASLAVEHNDRATDDQWKIATETYLKEMGFDLDKTQFVVYRHSDRDHDHIHIIANRVQLDGKVISDSNERYRSHTATRAAEKAAGLTQYEEIDKKAEKGLVHGLRTAIDAALEDGTDLQQFKDRLLALGIQVLENRSSTGRLNGLSYSDADGRSWKGSDLGKQYSLGGLEKRGLQAGENTFSNRLKPHEPLLNQTNSGKQDRVIGIAGGASTGSQSGNLSIMLKNSVAGLTAGQKDKLKKDRGQEL